ncbi:MAG: SufD family Fe-S cluster assembly protein [Bacteroidales bacterium]|nr:SufD family Fe-S cluster assembly protein [Bacteroidales bacterium]
MAPKVYIVGKDPIPRKVILDEGQELDIIFVVLPGEDCGLAMDVELDAPGASATIRGLYLANGSQKVDITLNVRHNAGGCHSRQLVKGIASGNARASFYGRIYVAQDAQKTKAYQENHNILASDKARIDTNPQLEIYADDVECSHGATIGRLNPDEQFYMRSRGIPEAEARVLQMISFLAPVAGLLPEDLAAEVYDSLSKCQD